MGDILKFVKGLSEGRLEYYAELGDAELIGELGLFALPFALNIYNMREMRKYMNRRREMLRNFDSLKGGFTDVPITGGATSSAIRNSARDYANRQRRGYAKIHPAEAVPNLDRHFGSLPMTGVRQRRNRQSASASSTNSQETIREGIHNAMNPDDQLGTQMPRMTDDLDDDIKRAEDAGKDFTRRHTWRIIRNSINNGASIGTLKGILSRYAPTWDIGTTVRGKVTITDDTGKQEIIDPLQIKRGMSINSLGGSGGGASMGDIQYVSKFKFPKYARYNYVKWATYANEAARRTGVYQQSDPTKGNMEKGNMETGKRIHIPSSGLHGI